MSTYTEQQQRYLDQASGDDLDRRGSKYKCATCGDTGVIQAGTYYGTRLVLRHCPACAAGRPTRSKEAVALDLAVDAMAMARNALTKIIVDGQPRQRPLATLARDKIDRALFSIAELRK